MVFIIIAFFFIPLLILVLLYIKIARNLVPTTEGDDQVSTDIITHYINLVVAKSNVRPIFCI